MKIAIIHDDLMRKGGAEQVALCFHQAFPDAPIFTLAYRPESTYPEFKNAKIITSWFQKIAINENVMKWLFFPLGILAMRSLRIKGFDAVIMSTTYCAKYVRLTDSTLSVCYCHQPFRLAWYPESYPIYLNAGPFKKILLNSVLTVLRKIDFHYSKKIDFFIANTETTKVRIAQCYTRDQDLITVIKPSVDCSKFYVSAPELIGEYFLVVSRLEYYKKVDIVVNCFNDLGLKLIIVGKGSRESELKKIAKNNIEFRSNIGADELAKLYSECQALIFPQIEDYGITPLEANSAGRPVIAFGQGGVLETMHPYSESTSAPHTALFFDQQTENSLKNALILFFSIKGSFNPEGIRRHAEKYDKKLFIKKIQDFVTRNQIK